MRLFNTIIISIEYSQIPILSTVLYIFSEIKTCSHPILRTYFLSVYFRTPATMKQTFYRSAYIFRVASIILKWEQLLEAASFSQKIFFRISSCLQQLLLSNNYSLVTNTSWRKILFSANVSEELFFRISNYSEHALFRSRYFFLTTTFSEEEPF